MSRDRNDPEAKARAEARFTKAEVRATEGAKAKAEHDAGVVARDANTKRLKGLRLDRDQADRDAAAANPPPAKNSRSRRPEPGPRYSWGDLNSALNALVQEGGIVGYQTNRGDKKADEAHIEVTVAVGADQAEVIGRVRRSLPDALSAASVWTRTA